MRRRKKRKQDEDSAVIGQALLLFIWMMCLWAPPDLHAWLRIFIATAAWKTAMMNC